MEPPRHLAASRRSLMKTARYPAIALIGAMVVGAVFPEAIVVCLALALVIIPVARRTMTAEGVLVLYVILLFGIPARLVIGPLGALGSPALLIGVITLWWFLVEGSVERPARPRRLTPVHVALMAYVLAMGAAYVAGQTRALHHLERGASDRIAITVMSLVGVALLTSVTLKNLAGVERLARRLVIAASAIACVGIIQFLTGWDPVANLSIPGLRANASLNVVGERSSFKRVTGTTSHAVEFGVVMAMIFPLALHFAMTRPWSSWGRRWVPVILIAVAIPFSVSRSAVLGLAAGLIVVVVAWPWRVKLNAAVITVVFVVGMRFAVPGLIGTIRSMFTGASEDPSVKGRTADLSAVRDMFEQRPFFGRGLGTLVPERYFFLDNQYFGTLVEAGLVGALAFATLLVVTIVASLRPARLGADPVSASLGRALGGGALVGAVSMATFDGLSFRVCAGVLFLLIGMSSALWSHHTEASPDHDVADESRSPAPVHP